MSLIGILLISLLAGALLILPRHLAAAPLLLGFAWITREPVFEIAQIGFTAHQLLVLAGWIRVIARRERAPSPFNRMDQLWFAWAVWLMLSSILNNYDGLVFRAGLIWIILGHYFLFRIFIHDATDVRRIFRLMPFILAPAAALMWIEHQTGYNQFNFLFAGRETLSEVRNGNVRACGPFIHPILAGTVAAACLPMALYIWNSNRAAALLGIISASTMLYAAMSSGPILMVGFIFLALLIWKARTRLKLILWGAVLCILALNAAMNDPVYFLMAKIDVVGGSAGWFRAQLIRSSIEHLNEWWLSGTDYTRHWMPTGIPATDRHTDFTNHYLSIGVMGGLPLLLLFILILKSGFGTVGRCVTEEPSNAFLAWTLGAILFGHLMNFFSFSLFDHSIISFNLVLACIAATEPRRIDAIPQKPPKQTLRCRERELV